MLNHIDNLIEVWPWKQYIEDQDPIRSIMFCVVGYKWGLSDPGELVEEGLLTLPQKKELVG